CRGSALCVHVCSSVGSNWFQLVPTGSSFQVVPAAAAGTSCCLLPPAPAAKVPTSKQQLAPRRSPAQTRARYCSTISPLGDLRQEPGQRQRSSPRVLAALDARYM
ncbi:unnamed protein product, partial [Ectocarpus fasciculatus]